MPLVPLKLPAGFYRVGTDFEGSNRWRDGSLVRWMDGSLRPIGGWTTRKANFANNPVRGMHSWQANDGSAWVAGGSHDQLIGMTGGGVCYDLTPDDLASGRESAAINTGYGFGFYGTGYYGNPRPVTSDSIPQEATTWQLDNFGQNLVGLHHDDGRIWEWDLTTTIGSELVTNGAFASDANWSKGTNWSISGGVAAYAQYKPLFDADDTAIVDVANDTITITSHSFSDGDEVTYSNGSGVNIGNLTTGTNYFIVSSTTNTFKLSATSGGSAINLTANNSVTVDATDAAVVVLATDKIVISNTFANGDSITYSNGGGGDITGLTNGTNYFIINRTASEFQLSTTSNGSAIDLTALGSGTSHSFRQDIGSVHQLSRVNFGNLDQTASGLVATPDAQDSYDVTVDLIDPNDDSDASTVPNVKIKVTGTTSTTVLVHETLAVGSNIFRFGADDTAVKIEIIPQAYNTPNFDIDNISLRKKTVAEPIANAPINNKGVVVTEERFIFALGAGGNSRKVQWCDKENNTVWAATSSTEAGDIELATAGQIMQGIRARGVTLIITDTDAHVAQYQGPPYVYGFQRIGTHCGAVSRLSAVATDQGAYWYGQENFHYFDGNSVQTLNCHVHDYVFSDFNKAQQSKVWGMVNGANNEIWWFYCSGQSTEIDKYVAYDFQEDHWLIGSLARTSGVSRGVFAQPFMAKHGTTSDIMNHEIGHNYDGASIFCETSAISIGNGDQIARVTSVVSDEKTQGDVNLKFKTRFYPNGTEKEHGVFNPSNPTSVRFSGRQVRMRVEQDQAVDWRVGTMRLETTLGGKR